MGAILAVGIPFISALVKNTKVTTELTVTLKAVKSSYEKNKTEVNEKLEEHDDKLEEHDRRLWKLEERE